MSNILRKYLGSEIFGTNNIRTDEYVLLAQIKKEDNTSVNEIALEIEALDDMLSLLKIRSINNTQRRTSKGNIRRNSSFSDLLDNRLDMLIEDKKSLNN
jgi:hypothetical protein